MSKIQRVSRLFRWVFILMLIGTPLYFVYFWVNAPLHLTFGPSLGMNFIPAGTEILRPLSTSSKLLGAFVSLIPLTIYLLIFYFLVRLFSFYEKGLIFTIENVYYMRKLGMTLLYGQLANLIYQFFITGVVTMNNPHGHRYAAISIDNMNIGLLFVGFLLILSSWIMIEGFKLKKEQQLTV